MSRHARARSSRLTGELPVRRQRRPGARAVTATFERARRSLQAKRIGSFRQLLVAPRDLATSVRRDTHRQDAAGDQHQHDAGRARSGARRWRALRAARFPGCGASKDPTTRARPTVLDLPSGGIHTVYPAARFRPPKVTALVRAVGRKALIEIGSRPERGIAELR